MAVTTLNTALENDDKSTFIDTFNRQGDTFIQYFVELEKTLNKANTGDISISFLADEWEKLEAELKEHTTSGNKPLVWKQFIVSIDENLANKINVFRSNLDKLLKDVCKLNFGNCTIECLSSGSDALTSDIDVTVKGNCIVENFIHLKLLHDILIKIFEKSDLLKDKGSVLLSKVYVLFDINFYLSNFGIKYSDTLDSNNLDSYIISHDMSKQIKYAIEGYKGVKKDYANLVYELAILRQNIQKGDQKKANEFVDIISQIAAQEDECYITQGAFFHIVMQLQQGQQFTDSNSFPNLWNSMMVCSAIENIKFAVSHESSRGKYLIRVFDALKRIKHISSSESNATSIALNQMFLNLRGVLLNYFNEVITDTTTQELLKKGTDTEDNMYSVKAEKRSNELELNYYNNTEYKNNIQEKIAKNKNELVDLKTDYEPLKKQLTKELLRIDTGKNLFNHLQSKIISEAEKIISYIDNPSQFGGKTNFKKLLKDGKVVKKSVMGRERVIYVNSKRKQYIKSQGEFKSISSLPKKKT